MYAQILVEYSTKKLDRTFTYFVDPTIQGILKVGMKVRVPFGKVYVYGFVIGLKSQTDVKNLKAVSQIVDENLILNDELLKLGVYLKQKTLCSLIVAYQCMLPSCLKVREQLSNYNLYETYISLNTDVSVDDYILNNPRATKQIQIINYLKIHPQTLKTQIKSSALKTLITKGIVSQRRVKKYRLSYNKEIKKDEVLTKEQQKVFDAINLNHEQTYLLYGITGSGKTEIYIHLIKKVISMQKQALVLVPEITLTTQIVKRFYERFGNNVAVFHSGLSQGEKHDEYLKILNNEVSVIVGTRSAIFTPIKNLGIIIIDEEHSLNYKQQNTPKYHTIDMARFRAHYHNIPLLLASATPSLESTSRALKKVYKYLELNTRVGISKLPSIQIVDMILQMRNRNMIFSDVLTAKIKQCLEKHKQIILLLNRRGHSTIITCQNCGFTYKCPNCEVSLTYHKSTNNLRCHYCGYTIKREDKCPKCHEASLNYYGIGTEKLELELKKIFKEARIVRMDVDTTSKKGSYDKILSDFQEHKYDILLGTQMIAKGLDFAKVTLVGVINADLSLNIPDFKAEENTFSLLTQVAGRSGRSSDDGQVIIQTLNPQHEVFKYVVNNDYKGFFISQMKKRKLLSYPPYYFLATIKIMSKDYNLASQHANKIANYLKNNLTQTNIILGPTPASLFKLNNIYRFQIVIKYKKDNHLMKLLKTLDEQYVMNKDITLDIDPLAS